MQDETDHTPVGPSVGRSVGMYSTCTVGMYACVKSEVGTSSAMTVNH